ncbi:MAG: hypothetical protein ABFD03_03180 [Clostridiaceae bacterium]
MFTAFLPVFYPKSGLHKRFIYAFFKEAGIPFLFFKRKEIKEYSLFTITSMIDKKIFLLLFLDRKIRAILFFRSKETKELFLHLVPADIKHMLFLLRFLPRKRSVPLLSFHAGTLP